MKIILLDLLVQLRTLLIDFITSKKVLTAVLTTVSQLVIKDEAIRTRVLEIGLGLLGMQGLTDVGKAAAAMKADAMVKSGVGAPLILTRTPTQPGGVAVTELPPPVPASTR